MIRILVLLAALCNIAFMAFNTVIGPIARVVGLAEWQIGLIVSVAGVCWMTASRPWGRRADSVGRQAVLQTGLTAFTVVFALLCVSAALGLSGTIGTTLMFIALLITRGLLGGFYAAVPVASQALIADALPPEQRSGGMAALGAASGVGMILGPAIGGLLGAYSLLLPLLLGIVLSAVALIITIRSRPMLVTLERNSRAVAGTSPPLSWRDPRLRWPMFVAFCAMYSVMSAQVNTAFYIIDRYRYEAAAAVSATGLVLTAVGLALISAQLLVRRLNTGSYHAYWTPIRMMAYGAAIAAVGFALGTVMPTVLWMGVGYFVAGFGMGMVFPSFAAAASNAVSSQEQGISAGTMAAAQAAGMVAAPLFSTLLYHLKPELPFWVASTVLWVVCLGSIARLYQRQPSVA